jgi:uncharacterized phosphosugar-binding protein
MKHQEYYSIIKEQLARQFEEENESIDLTANYCADSICKDRVVHVFGCGHSQIFAMEVFYRAGGLVPVNALLIPHLALFPKAKLSTIQERVEGFSNEYLKLENTSPDDTMIIVSVSGRNAGAIDMALAAKEIGMKVIAITSIDFTTGLKSRHSSGKLLKDAADVVIDLKCIKGDACLSIEGFEPMFCGTSTVLGTAVMESIVARTVELCIERGVKPPVYVSSNLDQGDKINEEYIKKYSPIISCL